MGAGGITYLSAVLRERVQVADVVAGGTRHLHAFPDIAGEKLAITSELDVIIKQLHQAYLAGQKVVVLASGDPLCYGIGERLLRVFPAEALEVVPAPTSFQLAFAALAEPWHDAALLSVHARSLSAVVRAALSARVAAILTDNTHTPSVVARALLERGMPADSTCAVCENLGYAEQRIAHTTLAIASEETYAPLNVFVVWGVGMKPHPPGLPDNRFSTEAGLITQREVRLLVLTELALAPGGVLWDIGAGSGAVSIEAVRAQPGMLVYAVEQRAVMCHHIRENLRRHPAPTMQLVKGSAPEVCVDLPDPDAVFIGGSNGKLDEIITTVKQRIQPGGRMVITLVTIENLQIARACLPDAQVVQVQINQGVPISDMLRFDARNPVFVVTWRCLS